MIRLTALLAGLLCGVGLVISGMTDPARLRGFLDPGPAWDPTFGLGLGMALLVSWLGVRVLAYRGRPLLGAAPDTPQADSVDGRLILASVLVGLGLGLTGFSPGTAFAAAGLWSADAATFLAAVLAGMLIVDLASGAGPGRNRSSEPRRWSRG